MNAAPDRAAERPRMFRFRLAASFILCMALSSSPLTGQDLSGYRGFRLGTTAVDVARQAGITAEARVVHKQPQLIEELIWLPDRPLSALATSGDSLRQVVFTFYDGQLFRIVVNYDWGRTEGMTVADLLDALSSAYGDPLLPATEIGAKPPDVHAGGDVVVAHWEDAAHAVDLFRPSYAATFGLLLVHKELNGLARTAIAEAARLDAAAAPERAIEQKRRQESEEAARQEKTRAANKARFRP